MAVARTGCTEVWTSKIGMLQHESYIDGLLAPACPLGEVSHMSGHLPCLTHPCWPNNALNLGLGRWHWAWFSCINELGSGSTQQWYPGTHDLV